jgi:hypothetical protein
MVESMTREELNQHLFALVGSESLVKQWWVTPNRNWKGQEPEEIWVRNPEEVISYVMRFCYGD